MVYAPDFTILYHACTCETITSLYNMCVCVWGGGRSFGSCVGVLVVTVLVFTAFCIICTVSLYCSVYVYLFLFVLSVQV